MAKIFNCFCLLFFLIGNTIAQQTNQITYIANEGVFIEYEGKKVLIDALHRKYKEYYQFTLVDYNLAMVAGKAPFDSVDVMMVTHLHGDHIHIDDTKDFLGNNLDSKFIASQQVLDTMGQMYGLQNQIYAIDHKGKGLIYQMDGLDIYAFPLLHSFQKKNHSIENTAYLLDFEGLKILHIGDAELSAENFKRLKTITNKGVDYALIPNWFFSEGENMEKLKMHIKAKKYIAIHISKLESGHYERKLKERIKDSNLDLNVFMKVGEREPLKK